MKKVALLYDGLLDVGGVEDHLLSILNGGYSSNYSFILLSQVSERFSTKIKLINVKIVQPKRRHLMNPIAVFEIAKTLKVEKVDLLHAHSPSSALWGRVAARLLSVPAIVTVHLPVGKYHGSLETIRAKTGRVIYKYLDQWLNNRPRYTRKIIYVAQNVYERELKIGQSASDNSTVIVNGVDLQPFDNLNRMEARNHFNLSPSSKIITFAGRLDEQKGVDVLIEAMAILNKNKPGCQVWLIGDGPLRQVVEDQIRALNLDETIKLWGFQEEIPLYLKASDIFVLPSRYEGMSLALLKGLAAGLPCVVTNVGDNDRLVNDGENGFVIPPDDIERLAKALETVLCDDDLYQRMSASAKFTANDFTEEKMIKQLERVYNECVQV